MEILIVRRDDTLSSKELKDRLENLPDWDNSIKLEIKDIQSIRLRSVDPTVLVAICGMAGGALGALITGILKVKSAKESIREKVVLVTKDGLRIEIESRNALEKIPELIKLVKLMEIKRIER